MNQKKKRQSTVVRDRLDRMSCIKMYKDNARSRKGAGIKMKDLKIFKN